jgi:hypothetical protein
MKHSREEVIERTKREFMSLDQLLEGLREEDWDLLVPRPEGKDPWTVKDAVAHITHWKADVIRSIHGQRRPAEQQALSENEANHFIYMQWHAQSWREVLAWHRHIQEELVQALQSAPEKWFSGRERRAEWPYDLDGHSAFHRTRDIERALGSGVKK